MNKSDPLAKQIHNEIDTAQDRLLSEARKIIESAPRNNKAERLEAIGFTASVAVKEHKRRKEVLVQSTEEANIIEYYKANYPFQKFLTERELERICNKYNLIHAPVARYIKDVPEKNLTEIEKAKTLRAVDAPTDIHQCVIKRYSHWTTGFGFMDIWSEWYRKTPKVLNRHFDNQFRLNDYIQETTGNPFRYICESFKNITIKRQGLFIAAPQSHFDLKGLKNHKHGFFNFKAVEVKDPIVFRYCKGGIQVLSKWGIEAEDSALVNEINN